MRAAALGVSLGIALHGLALAAPPERVPVAVLWLGDPGSIEAGQRTTEAVNQALGRAQAARPIDSAEDRKLLIEGGAATRALQALARAEAFLGKFRLEEAVREYELAERLLLTEAPLAEAQHRLYDVERGLLVCFDQLGRPIDAARAAERLGFTPGSHEDVRALLERHQPVRTYQPVSAPVRIESDPPGASVFRDLAPAGAAPVELPGGDPEVDFVDLELPGYRRVHLPLGRTGGTVRVTLEREERVGALVDRARALAPDVPVADVAALGRRVGATRVLAMMPDGPAHLLARWLDVRAVKWGAEAIRVDAATGPAPSIDRLARYVAPGGGGPPVVAAAAQEAPKKKLGTWGRWYTWVAAGAVVALVGGLLIAQNVGDDQVKITVSK